MKELVIDKKTNINNIKDKDVYEKLTLKCKVNPNRLKGFSNVKELKIKRNKKGFNVYNEVHINELPFKEKIEKIIFDNIKNYGIHEYYNLKPSYVLDYPNLKNIEFIGELNSCNRSYFNLCKNLEIMKVDSDRLLTSKELALENTSLKKIILLKDNKEYIINFDYKPSACLLERSYDEYFLEYIDNNKITRVKIDNEEIKQEHTLTDFCNEMIIDKTIFIPNYISFINIRNASKLKEWENISFNLNLLKTQKEKTSLLGYYNKSKLKKIIIRSNNEMCLFPNREIEINKNDELRELYIKNNKLYIIYKNKFIIIDENGKETIKELVIKNKKDLNDNFLNEDKLEELEEYFYYKRLLELISKKYNDEELKNAMNIVGDRIVKKLTK